MAKKENRRRKAGLIIAVACIFIIGILCWQWEMTKIVFMGIFYSEEQQTQMIEKKEQKVQAILENMPDVDVAPLPPEADKLLAEGIISEEEAMGLIEKSTTLETLMEEKGVAYRYTESGRAVLVIKDETGRYVVYDELPKTEKPENKQEPVQEELSEEIVENSQPVEEADTKQPVQKDTPVKQSSNLQVLISKIYVLRSTYIGKLDGLIVQAKQEYRQDKSKKRELQGKYLRIGSSMEKECDAQMEALISQIHAELIRTGGDLTLIDEIRAVYAQEKSAKKAALFAQYGK